MYSRLAHNLRVRLHADEVCRMQWRRKSESYKNSNYVSHLGFFFLEHNLVFHHNGRKCCIIVVTSLDRAQGACFLMHSGCNDRAHDWGPGGQVQVLTGTLWIVSTDEGRDWKADLHSFHMLFLWVQSGVEWDGFWACMHFSDQWMINRYTTISNSSAK